MMIIIILNCILLLCAMTGRVITMPNIESGDRFRLEVSSSAEAFMKDKPFEFWQNRFDNFVFNNGGLPNITSWMFFNIGHELRNRDSRLFSRRQQPPASLVIRRRRPLSSTVLRQSVHQKFTSAAQPSRRKGSPTLDFSLQPFAPYGCRDDSGFHFEGEVWFSRGCRRHKCLHFGQNYFVETDQCDTEIYNTTYKCVLQADLEAHFPHCCPTYVCNPDNLGNRISVSQ